MRVASIVKLHRECFIHNVRFVFTRVVLVAFMLVCVTPVGGADETPSDSCTHDAVMAMGATLHDELDVGSPKWRSAKTDAEKAAANEALIALMEASDIALRGEDAQACRLYRQLADEQGIDLR